MTLDIDVARMDQTSVVVSAPGATKTVTARCFCKAVRFSVTVEAADLPLAVHLCSCSICRRTHGTLSTFHAPLPRGASPAFDPPSARETALTGYVHADGAKSERLFCSTCGCHVGDVDLEPDSGGRLGWRVASSVFDDHSPDLFSIRTHVFAGPEQGAGGMREWLPRMGDREMRVWNPGPGHEQFREEEEEDVVPAREFDADGNEVLRAECHCGGVSFTLPRPSAPHVVASDAALQQWVSPLEPDRWTATLDLCDDCRLVDGAHVVGWTYVPLEHLRPRVPADFSGFGTLKAYESTPGEVRRAFCGVCGATVFYRGWGLEAPTSPRRRIVDLAVGLLRAPEGVAAERWLTWRTGRLDHLESGRRYDPLFAESLREGFDAWGLKTYGRSVDFTVTEE